MRPITLAARDYLMLPLRVGLTLIQSNCPALCDVQVRSYRRLRQRRLMPHELRAAPVLDEAARLLALACDLDLQGLDQYAGPLVLEASRLLARADFLLRGSAA
jgi:hypothetical protein